MNRPVFDRLQTLGEETRSRVLLLVEEHEFTVSELCAILQLPQSTVSRHLKVLAEDGWVLSRADGTSRHYRLAELDAAAAELWAVVRQAVADSAGARGDAERAASVLARRRERSREFFASAAPAWDALRAELFGREAVLLPLSGLLDPSWTVADLGAGTGALAERLAPFVARVIAVDGSPEMLDALRERVGGAPAVDARPGELEALPIEDGSVDVAFMLLVLHFVVEPRAALAEARRVLRPGGRLVVVDMREHDREEYRADMGHVWTGFSAEQMAGWSERAGFEDSTWLPLPPDAEAKGPLLFLSVERKGDR
jgi:ArsR family transcriptional regulator